MQTKTTNKESVEQISLFRWAMYFESKYPELALLYHVPNGGKRDKVTAARLKTEGVKAGVPDLVLPVGRDGYLGLYIEMKVGKNRTTKEQKKWLKNLTEQGYKTAVCYDWMEASELLEDYLGKKPTLEIIKEWRKSNEA
ncbi:MAG: VRR-NUC domain-containing protein [Ruminococcus sp.]|nr:VRR-NUC domain-containing protein [Ruminococcus sp.]